MEVREQTESVLKEKEETFQVGGRGGNHGAVRVSLASFLTLRSPGNEINPTFLA